MILNYEKLQVYFKKHLLNFSCQVSLTEKNKDVKNSSNSWHASPSQLLGNLLVQGFGLNQEAFGPAFLTGQWTPYQAFYKPVENGWL